MRDYSKISPAIWTGRTGRSLRGDPEAQIVHFYLLTTGHANMLGAFYCPPIYIAHETGLSLEGASKGLRRLIEVGFCTYEEDIEYVWVHEMARFQIGESLKPRDNRISGVLSEFLKMPESRAKHGFYQKYKDAFLLPEMAAYESPFEAPSKPVAVAVAVAVTGAVAVGVAPPDSSAEPDPPKKPQTIPIRQGDSAPRKKPESKTETKSGPVWNAYAAAYFDRYHVEPVRNAKVNGQLAALVDRLGGDEAPRVAEFFLNVNARYYLERGHSVDVLLADAEKLRTQWATGRVITSTQAQQADRMQANSNLAQDLIAELCHGK